MTTPTHEPDGPGRTTVDGRALPPVVYVPTTDEPDAADRRIVLHRVTDGRTALYAYSALDRLHDHYLPESRWVLCDGSALQRIHDATPYDLLFVDVDPGLRDHPGAAL
ncbi:SAV_915 family protein [Nocardioides ferulae]|uniref:SAV_915 family protein n=1 Tax=Nocardioides ferulae TaxID=2340821 RepID=UPI000EAD525E|nr:SAV_915 family protein [Nocardioides ferulae]